MATRRFSCALKAGSRVELGRVLERIGSEGRGEGRGTECVRGGVVRAKTRLGVRGRLGECGGERVGTTSAASFESVMEGWRRSWRARASPREADDISVVVERVDSLDMAPRRKQVVSCRSVRVSIDVKQQEVKVLTPTTRSCVRSRLKYAPSALSPESSCSPPRQEMQGAKGLPISTVNPRKKSRAASSPPTGAAEEVRGVGWK